MNRERLVNGLYRGFLHREPKPAELAHWVSQLETTLDVNRLIDALLSAPEFVRLSKKNRDLFVAPGHFYSPVVDAAALQANFNPPVSAQSLAGIRISQEAHVAFWSQLVPFLRDIPFSAEESAGFRYYFRNPAYSWGDGSILHAMLRRFRPRRLVEVGSGFSSACAMDTIERYLDASVEISFVEPYPELLLRLLGEAARARCTVHAQPVQNIDPAVFSNLQDGDFLFIDSTHVMKTGSDVCHELFEVLPALNPGVFIHFHDIFWPFEYGRNWVLKENRSWNEIYGLRAFLMYNHAFEIVFFNDYFVRHCRPMIEADYPAMLNNTGGSIWLRKVG